MNGVTGYRGFVKTETSLKILRTDIKISLLFFPIYFDLLLPRYPATPPTFIFYGK